MKQTRRPKIDSYTYTESEYDKGGGTSSWVKNGIFFNTRYWVIWTAIWKNQIGSVCHTIHKVNFKYISDLNIKHEAM